MPRSSVPYARSPEGHGASRTESFRVRDHTRSIEALLTMTKVAKHQAVGAFGERAVEAELLRHGWTPANVNATVKNAANFDIFAVKDNRTVHIRAKTCGPGVAAFQFNGFTPNHPVSSRGIGAQDFTILVCMGAQRADDQFYVVPTVVVRKEIKKRQSDYTKTLRRDGRKRKDTGHWALRLGGRKNGRKEGGWGLAEKWHEYCGDWSRLDGA